MRKVTQLSSESNHRLHINHVNLTFKYLIYDSDHLSVLMKYENYTTMTIRVIKLDYLVQRVGSNINIYLYTVINIIGVSTV